MSQNVQLAGMLLPVQPAPVQSALHTARDKRILPDAQDLNASDVSGEPAKTGDGSAKNAGRSRFDAVLNERIEKRQTDAPEPAETEETMSPETVAAELTLAAAAQLSAGNAAQLVQPVIAEEAPQESILPQTAMQPQAADAPAAQVQTGALQQVPPDVSAIKPEPTEPNESFQTLLNDKQTADENIRPTEKPVDLGDVQKPAQTGLENAAAKAGKELPVQPQTNANKGAENMPALPQQAVQNTADKPAALKSPVLAAQIKAPVEDTSETLQTAKLRAGLKNAYQTRPSAAPAAEKQAAVLEKTAETSAAMHTVVQGQHKSSELNVTETKVTGTENAAAARIRAADAVSTSRPAEQIAQSLPPGPAQVGRQIRLVLTPPELGTVRITFREQEGEIIGVVEAQRTQTRKDLEESLPQLVSSMQNQGLQVRRVEVIQWNTPQQGTRDQLSENYNPSAEREFMQQGANNPHEGSRNADGTHADGAGNRTGKQSVIDVPDSNQWFSDKGLNLYI